MEDYRQKRRSLKVETSQEEISYDVRIGRRHYTTLQVEVRPQVRQSQPELIRSRAAPGASKRRARTCKNAVQAGSAREVVRSDLFPQFLL